MKNNFWENKKVFVTGVTGLLGSWMALELVQRGASVVGLVRDQVPESNFYSSGTSKRVTIVMGNVTDFELLSRTLQEYEIEYCFHLAAQAIVGFANQDPLPTFESNIRGTWSVLEACRRRSEIKGIVIASSDKAYGSQAIPYREEAPLLGQNPYDVSKVCADYLARAYGKSFRLSVAITRCSNLFGGGDLNFSRIIPGTIRSLLLDQAPVIRSDGSPTRDYVYVKDAVQGYLTLAEKLSQPEVQGEAFNFGSARPVSVLDLTNQLIEISGKRNLEPVILGKGKMRGEIDQQYLSIDKARKVLGWSPEYSFEGALRETYLWYQKFFNANKSFVIQGAAENV